jgi:uncharacterized protein with HEPN domain
MKNKDIVVLRKMLKYCADSLKYSEGVPFGDFVADERNLVFSIFSLSQLGELAGNLSDAIIAANNDIPWGAIRGIRNRIVHDYDGVKYQILWNILQRDMRPLMARLAEIMREFDM